MLPTHRDKRSISLSRVRCVCWSCTAMIIWSSHFLSINITTSLVCMSLCHSHNLYPQPHIISDTPSPPQPPPSPLSLSPPSLLPLGPAFLSPRPPFLFIVASLAVRPRLPWRRDSFPTLMTVPRLVGGHSPPPPPPPHQGLIWGDTANITHTHTQCVSTGMHVGKNSQEATEKNVHI